MTLANSVVAKLSVAFVALATAFVLAVPAQAAEMTDAEMEAEIARLTALLSDLLGDDTTTSSSSVCPYQWTRSLSVGDTGPDVMKLQQFLNSDAMTRVAATGVGSAGMETEYYGALTGAAVAKFQEANRAAILSPLGLVNATTFFGPSTMAEANKQCASAPTPSDDDDTTGDDDTTSDDDDDTTSEKTLGDGEGSVEDITRVSPDESSLEEGKTQGLFAFEVEIQGDVEINRVDVYLDSTDAGAQSENADDYFEGAELWVDGEKVADLDVTDFSEDSYAKVSVVTGDTDEYRLRFSGLGLVFEDGDEPEFQVALEALGNIDGTDESETWGFDSPDIRYIDGEGFTDSYTEAGIEEDFTIDAEEVAEIEVTSSTEDPDATTIEVDEDEDTEDETVFAFEVEEVNGVDVTIEDLTVTLATDDDQIVTEAFIYDSSDNLLDSQTVTGAGAINFEDMGFVLAGDSSEDLIVKFTFDGLTGNYAEGATVTVAFTSIDDAVDENGNDATTSGTPSGEVHTLRTVGLVFGSEPTDGTGSTDSTQVVGETTDDNYGTMFLEFEITAFGDDLWVPIEAATAGAADSSSGLTYEILKSGVATSTNIVTVIDWDIVGANEDNSYYELEKGETYTVNVTVESLNPEATGLYSFRVNSIGYNDTEDTAPDTGATPDDTTEYESDAVSIQS